MIDEKRSIYLIFILLLVSCKNPKEKSLKQFNSNKYSDSIQKATAISDKWYGKYSFVINEDSADWRDAHDISITINADSVTYLAKGFQLYQFYKLSVIEKNGNLKMTFEKVLDNTDSWALKKTKDFGTITFDGKNYIWNSPYIDISYNENKKVSYVLKKSQLNPASGVNEESYEGNEVEDEENTSNNKEIDYSFNTLKGSWSYDCENASSLKINNEELIIPVIFNQYYIHLTRIDKKNDAGVFKYKLKIMEGSGAEDETSKDYFNDTEIVIVKIIDNNTIEFNWLGFYNKSNKQRQYTDPHFGDQNPIVLKKCEYGN